MDRYRLSLSGRVHVSYALVAIVFFFLLFGLIKLQIVQHTDLAEQSENNRIRVEPIVPRRGVVYDREGRIIIDNRPSYTLSVVPAEIIPGKTIENLSNLLGLDSTQ
ncbi:MAG TPA: penicillin-binding protein 2, partial [candidate division Zixibacteria bacterium]|nr:penicillin-binding protein 2 [candidate division Zixibacteria bacterium]